MNSFVSVQQNIVRWSHPLGVYSLRQLYSDIFTIHRQVDHLNTSDNYWSSSSYVSDDKNAWIVNFKNGNTNNNNKTNENYVRCVRGR
jgi:hypothetical protein